MTEGAEKAKVRLRDARLTEVQGHALLAAIDDVSQTCSGPAAFNVLRRIVVDVQTEAGAVV
jgi:hypothetical protein